MLRQSSSIASSGTGMSSAEWLAIDEQMRRKKESEVDVQHPRAKNLKTHV
jgi:hypothetical protein